MAFLCALSPSSHYSEELLQQLNQNSRGSFTWGRSKLHTQNVCGLLVTSITWLLSSHLLKSHFVLHRKRRNTWTVDNTSFSSWSFSDMSVSILSTLPSAQARHLTYWPLTVHRGNIIKHWKVSARGQWWLSGRFFIIFFYFIIIFYYFLFYNTKENDVFLKLITLVPACISLLPKSSNLIMSDISDVLTYSQLVRPKLLKAQFQIPPTLIHKNC